MENNNVDIGKEEADQTTVSLPSLEALGTSQEDLVNQNPQDIKDLFRKVEEEVAGIKFASKRLKRKIMAQEWDFYSCYRRRSLKWMIALMFLMWMIGMLLVINNHRKKKTTYEPVTNVPLNGPKPLVDIFTTLTDKPKKVDVYKNALMNWGNLDTAVRAIVFTDSTMPSTLDCQQNISVFPFTRTNQYGYPFLKDMFYEADKLCSGDFIGFVNADILFDESLRETLMAVKEYFKDDQKTSVLVVGNRLNANITYAQKSLHEAHDVTKFAKDYSNNEYQHPRSSDYFFIKNIKSFPWHKIKDVVIGTTGFDGYLIHMANMAGENVVDATRTILALHQTGVDGNFASILPNRAAIMFNRNLTKVTLGCGMSVPATRFYSERDKRGAVKMIIRKKIIDPLPRCKGRKYKKTPRK